MVTVLLPVIVPVILFAMILMNAVMLLITAASMLLVPITQVVPVACAKMVTMETVYNAETTTNVTTTNNDFCSDDASCNNTECSFSCSDKTGYKDNDGTAYGGQVSVDIEEYADNTDNCVINASCTNNIGSLTC